MNTNDKQKEANKRNYGNARERVFTVRLTQEEADKINDAVTQTNTSKGAVIRAAIENIQIRTPNPKVTDDVLRELSAIGNNINQLARLHNEAHQSGLQLSGLGLKLSEIKSELEAIKERL